MVVVVFRVCPWYLKSPDVTVLNIPGLVELEVDDPMNELLPNINPNRNADDVVLAVPVERLPPTNGSVMLVKLLQPLNAPSPIDVTLFGTTNVVILKFRNASVPIVCKPLLSVSVAMFEQLVCPRFLVRVEC